MFRFSVHFAFWLNLTCDYLNVLQTTQQHLTGFPYSLKQSLLSDCLNNLF